MGSELFVKPLLLVLEFEVVPVGLKLNEFFMWTGQKSVKTGHEKLAKLESESDIFAGRTFTIGELTLLEFLQKYFGVIYIRRDIQKKFLPPKSPIVLCQKFLPKKIEVVWRWSI